MELKNVDAMHAHLHNPIADGFLKKKFVMIQITFVKGVNAANLPGKF